MKNKISKNVYENLLIATIIMLYFIVINFLYYKLSKSIVLLILKILSMVILTICIIILSGHTLSTAHIVELQKIKFANYILLSSYVFSIYYLFKALCIYTKERRDYVNSLSDIKEIVANDPIKKDATKKEEKIS